MVASSEPSSTSSQPPARPGRRRDHTRVDLADQADALAADQHVKRRYRVQARRVGGVRCDLQASVAEAERSGIPGMLHLDRPVPRACVHDDAEHLAPSGRRWFSGHAEDVVDLNSATPRLRWRAL